MAELREVAAEIKNKLEKMADTRRLVALTLLQAFPSGKSLNVDEIKKVQRAQKSLVSGIIEDLKKINSYLLDNADVKQHSSVPEIEHARVLVAKELAYFEDLEKEFFRVHIPTGFVDAHIIRARFQVDKIVATVNSLNVLVGNIKEREWENEENLIKYLRKTAA